MRYFFFLIISLSLFADTGVDAEPEGSYQGSESKYKPKGPWLTGPIVTTSAYTVPKGHFNIEPYVYVANDFGHFNAGGHILRHDVRPTGTNVVFCAQMGLAESIDLNIYPQFTYSYGTGKDDISMGDLIIGPSFQIFKNNAKFYGVTWKWGLNQLFPCGTFENLDPVYSGNDGPGLGAWSTTLYTAAAKLFHIQRENFFDLRTAFSTIFYVPTKLHGRNSFGGDETTDGTLTKGPSFIWDIGMEFTLSLNWALALDIENQYTIKSTFKGQTIEKVGNPNDSYILSFAPAIEYNHSVGLGVIAGVWVGAIGIDTEDFLNYVIAVNWYQ